MGSIAGFRDRNQIKLKERPGFILALENSMKAAKRELIDTGTDKRYVRRNEKGEFKESDDVGKSLSQDQKRAAAAKAKPGQGDKGDR
jgi:hypothetical protein